MNAIGFENFRKFAKFPIMELGNINILVGTNNSGKSSVAKALLLVQQNIDAYRDSNWGGEESSLPRKFIFSNYGTERISLGDYKTCKHNLSGVDETISFTWQNKDERGGVCSTTYILENPISDDNKDILIKEISITHDAIGITLKYKYEHQSDIVNFELELDHIKACKWVNRWASEWRMDYSLRQNKFDSFVNYLQSTSMTRLTLDIKNKNVWNIIEDERCKSLEPIFDHISLLAYDYDVYNFIETHVPSRDSLINLHDKNDYLAQTLQLYMSVTEGYVSDKNESPSFLSEMEDFSNNMLDLFDLGKRFEIIRHFSHYATVDLLKNNAPKTSLCDMGTGSIQLFILILRIVIAIFKTDRYNFRRRERRTIIVEEPEMNLHPALQSRLNILFNEAIKFARQYNIELRFVVETHSEYLVRSCQVHVAKEIKAGNKSIDEMNDIYKVYYFQERNIPYKRLSFKNNGRFDDKFGEGFYDEAVRSNHQLTLIERED